MNFTMNFDLTDPNILLVINDKLVAYKSIISFQKEEILKTEAIIKQYTDHLEKQNEALKLYLEEEEELKRKENEIIKTYNILRNTKNIIEDIQILSEEDIIQAQKEINFDNEIEMTIPQANKSYQNLEIIIKNYQNNISTINVTEINNETVYSMSIFDKDIFIGGSNGMLMKYSSKETFIYETNTKEDILQLEIIKHKGNIFLFAFIEGTIIIYKNIEEPHIYRHIDLPGIEHVSKFCNLLYIPLRGGILHKLNTENCSIKQLKVLNKKYISSIATGYTKKDFSLAVFKNGLLYKCKMTEDLINNFEQVKGVQDLRRVLKIDKLGYVYYSDTTIWIVDYNLKDVNNEKFENGIKFVEVLGYCLAVVDHDNTLHIYRYKKNKQSFKKCYGQRIIGDITAISILRQKVYLSVGKKIIIIDSE